MIPNSQQILVLWDKYCLPEPKRVHVTYVSRVALFLANRLMEKQHVHVDISLLEAAALLHDIDKNVEKLPNEHHPDACLRILRQHGYDEVANIVATHPLHAIADPDIAPKTWEEKLLFLADKMVKYDIGTVDSRFALWRNEADMPEEGRRTLEKTYPLVKKLEKEVFTLLELSTEEVAKIG